MPHVARFDCFEVDLDARVLRKRGARIRLRDQPFEVLAFLLEHPGELITRQALCGRLWPDGVFVDFDNSLNTAVARVRVALGDSARRPRFIETLPKRGYRFVGDVSPACAHAPVVPVARPRLAVLPFVNLSGDPGQEYFSDAMTDEIITQLANVAPERLGVIARTSAMQYKGVCKGVARVSRELGVDYIVEGAVHAAKEQVAVNVQLVQASDQVHLFAGRYQVERREILRLQGSIARDVAAHIPSIGSKVEDRFTRKITENLPAYEEYIRGRYEMWKWTPEGVAKAKQHLERALALDPNFALACDALANLYGYLGLWGLLPPDEAEPYRWFYGLRAFELDPGLAEPRTHVAYHPQKSHYEDGYTYNWRDAEKGMADARDRNPNSPLVRVRHASVLGVLGKTEEAVSELEHALTLDPLSLEVRCWLALELLFGRQFDRGIEVARQLVDLEPGHHLAHMILGLVYLGAGRYDESAGALRRAAELSEGFDLALGWLGLALGLGGRTVQAQAVLERLRDTASQRFVLPSSFAWVHLGLANIGEAFAWMERAVRQNDEWVHPLKVYPFLDPLRSDPRFHALLRKLSLEP